MLIIASIGSRAAHVYEPRTGAPALRRGHTGRATMHAEAPLPSQHSLPWPQLFEVSAGSWPLEPDKHVNSN